MSDQPTGIITFLFTDVEGSSGLWESQPEVMSAALARHDDLVRAAVSRRGGYVFATGGDSFSIAFSSATDAVDAATSIQQGVRSDPAIPFRVRIGLHTGQAEERDGDYFGPAVNRAARLMGSGHGSQILVSRTTFEIVEPQLRDGMGLVDLGMHRLPDLTRPENVYQLTHPDLPTEFPPIRTLDTKRNNLPAQVTSLVGRSEERERVAELLDAARLVTLTGTGGVGKTRLALEVGTGLVDGYSDGVWLVDLSAVDDPDLVVQTVADVLAIKEEPGRALHESIVATTRHWRALILLDNCEHLVEAAADLATALLRSTDGIDLLATSRRPLDVQGEQVFVVHPLALPSADDALASMTNSPAVALLQNRAQLAGESITVTSDNAEAIARICVLLDGLPLAIEMAAARLRTFSPEQLADRLGERLLSIGTRRREDTGHHSTMDAAIDWSYDLLDGDEQAVFRRLSIFDGTFTLQAAEAIAGGERSLDTVEHLARLVDQSLLSAVNSASGKRLRLLVPVRDYARGRLHQAGEWEAVAAEHFTFYTTWIQSIRDRAHRIRLSPDELAALDADLDNLRAAFKWGMANGRIRDTGAFASQLWAYWLPRATPSEALEWYRDLEPHLDQLDPEDQVGVLHALGTIISDDTGGILLLPHAAAVESERYLLAALDAFERYGVPGPAAGLPYNNLGVLAAVQGDWEAALEWFGKAYASVRDGIDHRMFSTSNIAEVYLELGDLERAEEFARESLAESRREASRRHGQYVPGANHILCQIAVRRGDYDTAEALALEMLQAGAHNVTTEIRARYELAVVALARGDNDVAAARVGALAPLEGTAPSIVLLGACVEAARGHFARATALAAAIRSHGRPRLRIDRTRLEEAERSSRAHLTPDETARHSTHGASMTIDQAAAYFLQEAPESDVAQSTRPRT